MPRRVTRFVFLFFLSHKKGVAALHHRGCKLGQYYDSDWVGGREKYVLDVQGMLANPARRNQKKNGLLTTRMKKKPFYQRKGKEGSPSHSLQDESEVLQRGSYQ